MLDIRLLREEPDRVKGKLAARGGGHGEAIDRVLATDRDRRGAETELQRLQSERNRVSKLIGQKRARGEPSADLEAEVRASAQRIAELDRVRDRLAAEQEAILLSLPNEPLDDVPAGADASANVVLRHWGTKPEPPTRAQDHLALGAALGILDFDRAAKVSGSGFIWFHGQGARLERALVNFLLDLHTREHGYVEVAPPCLVRRESMVGTGQLPKFEPEMYGLEDGALFLAPTAEVPLTNYHREEILAADRLPVRLVAYTPCFRREAGSTGRDTRGMIRVHQFDKVELVQVVHPERSAAALEELTGHAERVLQLLGLHYRVVALCTGDLGFSAAKTYDIEVWAPAQGAYLEASSCSSCTDFQARRMNLRFKDEGNRNRFCHTLNGSGTALPRLYVALLETGQQPDGSILLPPPLHPYSGADRITRDRP